jgi:hypothetical protein
VSDWFETVVDVDADPEDAASLAKKVVSELVRRKIICSEPSDCTLGSLGYRPDSGIDDLLRAKDDLLFQLATNGLEVSVGRTVSIPPSLDSISCPLCNAEASTDTLSWGESVGDWYEGGEGNLVCPACMAPSSVVRWRHSPNAAFGHLAFTFWNWPPFDEANWVTTPARIIESTTGHRCEIVGGKL